MQERIFEDVKKDLDDGWVESIFPLGTPTFCIPNNRSIDEKEE